MSTSIKDYRAILRVIDKTFTHHEKRLAEIREETIAFMRSQLVALPTQRKTEAPSGSLPTERP